MSLPPINHIASKLLEIIDEGQREPDTLKWPLMLLLDGQWVIGYPETVQPADTGGILTLLNGRLLTSPPTPFDVLTANVFDVKAFAQQTGEFADDDFERA